jgi:hypothetical protein
MAAVLHEQTLTRRVQISVTGRSLVFQTRHCLFYQTLLLENFSTRMFPFRTIRGDKHGGDTILSVEVAGHHIQAHKDVVSHEL